MGNIINEDISKVTISPEVSIKDALKKLDESGTGNLFVCKEDKSLIGSLTDGDIRRRILTTGNLQERITHCFNPNPVCLVEANYTHDDVKKIMLDKTIEMIPIVDYKRRIVDVLFWKDIFEGEKTFQRKINIPVVIMAGGKGQRLDPFTKILPKPLIPIGERPIIEIIMDRFNKFGVNHYYVTINYKGGMVKIYFDGIKKPYKIDYIQEDDFLGTAGSLKLLPSDIKETFIVSNCDIIVEADYEDLVKFHLDNNNLLTIVGSIQHHCIPYGVLHFEKEGKLTTIQEKPELDFTINTGVYVLSKKILEFVPQKRHFDMTDLIKILLENKEKIGIYPVSEKSYIDTGQWEEYKKHIESLSV